MRACEELLEVEGILNFRMNSGSFFKYGEDGKIIGKIRGHKKGTADLLAFAVMQVPYGGVKYWMPITLWVECKSSEGEQRPEQEEFECRVLRIGHYYLLVDDAIQLQEWLKQNNAKGVR